MSSDLDTLELFDALPIAGSQLSSKRRESRKRTPASDGLQLRMFANADGLGRDSADLNLEPLDATFRDSNEAPLHSWFPYLEGYSPRFVDRVRREFLKDAKRIIEPFAGSGTTPIVLGQSGIECAFSEANPAMAFIAQVKLAVLRLGASDREDLSQKLMKLAQKLPRLVAAGSPDETLRTNYASTFGASVFFRAPAFEDVLRLRTVNDSLSATDSLLADCFAVAVLSSLIPCSLLKRAGDLRYRTPKELAQPLPLPIELVGDRLIAQAKDLSRAETVTSHTRLVCATAGSLHMHLDAGWDGVITSPPYLNGTNYIRNARLELWYLRHLIDGADIRRLRNDVVTSGINDVHAHTRWAPITEGVERVVRAIEANAYDSRIAKMVGGYFSDMGRVLGSLAACVRPGGRVCIDIGDSIYNHVHVPTDDLLVEVAEGMGYRTLERVHLRKRISKGGAAVRQQLLVFERPSKQPKLLKAVGMASGEYDVGRAQRPRRTRAPGHEWRSAWEEFKTTLPHQLLPYAKREWGGPAHSMCSYQGKMKPALAHHLIKCFSSPGDVVVDPFSGAGTIPFEACRMGRRGYGVDLSRLGHVLSLAKVAKTSSVRIESMLGELEASLKKYKLKAGEVERAAAVRFNSSIPDYFHPETLREVIGARSFFLSRWDSGPEWAVLAACTLHLLHGNRPYALSRRSHPVTPFAPTGEFEHRELMPRLREKLGRIHEELTDPAREWGGSAQGDCTIRWPSTIPHADTIITSPPFFDSTRFYMTNWMRFWFVGWEREDFDTQTSDFVETRQKKDLNVYKAFYAASRERLRDGGLLVLHLGSSAKCDMATELSERVTPWFSIEDVYTEGVGHCESHGIRDKGTVVGHSYLVLRAI